MNQDLILSRTIPSNNSWIKIIQNSFGAEEQSVISRSSDKDLYALYRTKKNQETEVISLFLRYQYNREYGLMESSSFSGQGKDFHIVAAFVFNLNTYQIKKINLGLLGVRSDLNPVHKIMAESAFTKEKQINRKLSSQIQKTLDLCDHLIATPQPIKVSIPTSQTFAQDHTDTPLLEEYEEKKRQETFLFQTLVENPLRPSPPYQNHSFNLCKVREVLFDLGEKVLRKEMKVNPQQIIEAFKQLFSQLGQYHMRDSFHGDLKPENILLKIESVFDQNQIEHIQKILRIYLIDTSWEHAETNKRGVTNTVGYIPFQEIQIRSSLGYEIDPNISRMRDIKAAVMSLIFLIRPNLTAWWSQINELEDKIEKKEVVLSRQKKLQHKQKLENFHKEISYYLHAFFNDPKIANSILSIIFEENPGLFGKDEEIPEEKPFEEISEEQPLNFFGALAISRFFQKAQAYRQEKISEEKSLFTEEILSLNIESPGLRRDGIQEILENLVEQEWNPPIIPTGKTNPKLFSKQLTTIESIREKIRTKRIDTLSEKTTQTLEKIYGRLILNLLELQVGSFEEQHQNFPPYAKTSNEVGEKVLVKRPKNTWQIGIIVKKIAENYLIASRIEQEVKYITSSQKFLKEYPQ